MVRSGLIVVVVVSIGLVLSIASGVLHFRSGPVGEASPDGMGTEVTTLQDREDRNAIADADTSEPTVAQQGPQSPGQGTPQRPSAEARSQATGAAPERHDAVSTQSDPRLTRYRDDPAEKRRLEAHIYGPSADGTNVGRPSASRGTTPEQTYQAWFHANDATAIGALAVGGRDLVEVRISDLASIESDVLRSSESTEGWALHYAQAGDQVRTAVTLEPGVYEVIIPIFGPDGTLNDAVYASVGGARFRAWGGWRDFEHHSHEPLLIRAPRTGDFELSIDATEEPGVRVDRVFIVPVHDHERAVLAVPMPVSEGSG